MRAPQFHRIAGMMLLGSLSLAAAPLAHAQAWPDRPVRIVVPFAAGAVTDIVSRLLADRLTPRLGKPVIIDNRPGANAIVGAEVVAKAAPDGYTVLMAGSSTHTVNPNLFKSLPYDSLKDFTEAVNFGGVRYYLTVSARSPIKTLPELLANAKANPGKLNYGAGNSTALLATELFKLVTNTDFAQINYKSNLNAATDLIGGTIQIAFLDVGVANGQIKSGHLRGIAYTGLSRSATLPDVPTFGELGFAELQKISGWFGLWFPANTPKPIVDRFNREVNAVRDTPDFAAKMAEMGISLEGAGGTPEDFARFVREDLARWARVVKEAKIPLQ